MQVVYRDEWHVLFPDQFATLFMKTPLYLVILRNFVLAGQNVKLIQV